MANKHMGDLSHGKKIILEFNKLTKNYKKKLIYRLSLSIMVQLTKQQIKIQK
jgi:hypothetical protein